MTKTVSDFYKNETESSKEILTIEDLNSILDKLDIYGLKKIRDIANKRIAQYKYNGVIKAMGMLKEACEGLDDCDCPGCPMFKVCKKIGRGWISIVGESAYYGL